AETVNIVVAIQQIARGSTISPDMVELKPWDRAYLSSSAVYTLEDAVGKIARHDFSINDPLSTYDLAPMLEGLTALGSEAATATPIPAAGISAVLPQDTRGISIPAHVFTLDTSAIRIGDHIILTNAGTNQIVAQDALVIYTDAVGMGTERVISVAVFPEDTITITHVIDSGEKLTFTVSQPSQAVVIARQSIPAGTILTADLLALAYYPTESLPNGAYTGIQDLIGVQLPAPIQRGYPVVLQPVQVITTIPTPVAFSAPDQLATPTPVSAGALYPAPTLIPENADGAIPPISDLQPTVPTGLQVITLPATSIINGPGPYSDLSLTSLSPGVVVNINGVVTYLDAVPNSDGSIPPTIVAVGTPLASVATIIHDAIVVQALDPVTSPGGIALAVSPQDAVVLTYYIEARIPVYLTIYTPGTTVQTGVAAGGLHALETASDSGAADVGTGAGMSCHARLSPEGKLYAMPSKDAWWFEGRTSDSTFNVQTMTEERDGSVWYRVQTEDGSVAGWIFSEDAVIEDICGSPTPVTGAGGGVSAPDLASAGVEVTVTPPPTFTPTAIPTSTPTLVKP
ncbi:MAG TPA: SAF domain-containing protein, partial [Phototrophicaceae bacterium]|nr:SAF domain-containing protein [Phototrophicaceae bacterium]